MGEYNQKIQTVDHYLGDKGRKYFAWQGELGLLRGLYNKHIWEPYIDRSDDVLDFGCGGGFLLKLLEVRKKVGVEVNPHARSKASELGIETYERVIDVAGKFDKVISSHALEHIPHPMQALLDIKTKLRDEHSRLLLLLPLDDWRSHRNKTYSDHDINMHLYTWTPQSLGNLLSSSGYKVLDIKILCHAWPPAKEFLWKTSSMVFHAAAFCWSLINKQRQLFAVASLK